MASHSNSKLGTEINTGYPGHIFNFDPETQMCEVQLAIESLFTGHAVAYTVEKKQRLQNVQVQFIQGGGWSLTHGIPDETPCWVHFAQRGIDHWKAENKNEAGMVNGKPAPAFSQLFSMQAAQCTIGHQPIPKAIKDFQNSGMELRNADRSQRITLQADGLISIFTGNSEVRLNKNGSISITGSAQIIAKAPTIKLDGDVTVTKSLTVQGGMAISGSVGGQTATFTGNMVMNGNIVQTGTFTLGGIPVNNHKHTNPEGGDVGPMKA